MNYDRLDQCIQSVQKCRTCGPSMLQHKADGEKSLILNQRLVSEIARRHFFPQPSPRSISPENFISASDLSQAVGALKTVGDPRPALPLPLPPALTREYIP